MSTLHSAKSRGVGSSILLPPPHEVRMSKKGSQGGSADLEVERPDYPEPPEGLAKRRRPRKRRARPKPRRRKAHVCLRSVYRKPMQDLGTWVDEGLKPKGSSALAGGLKE